MLSTLESFIKWFFFFLGLLLKASIFFALFYYKHKHQVCEQSIIWVNLSKDFVLVHWELPKGKRTKRGFARLQETRNDRRGVQIPLCHYNKLKVCCTKKITFFCQACSLCSLQKWRRQFCNLLFHEGQQLQSNLTTIETHSTYERHCWGSLKGKNLEQRHKK